MASLPEKTFKYVLIPEENTKALQELTIKYSDETLVPCLTNACKKHYQKKVIQHKELYREQIIAQLKDKDPNVQIQDNMLNMLTKVQLVSIEPLLYNEKNNDYYGVSLYCDDSAASKNSVVNTRATSIAHACGKNINVIGDAFLSASKDDQKDYFIRCDFTIGDLDEKNNNWIQRAKVQQKQLQAANAQNTSSDTNNSSSSRKKVSKKEGVAYKKKLIKWKEDKLHEFDSNQALQLKKVEKFKTRENYATFLDKKIREKCQSVLGYFP